MKLILKEIDQIGNYELVINESFACSSANKLNIFKNDNWNNFEHILDFLTNIKSYMDFELECIRLEK